MNLGNKYVRIRGFIAKNPLLVWSSGVLFVLSCFAFFLTEPSYETIESVSLWVRNHFGYFYLYMGLGCVIFLLTIALSPLGRIRLGKRSKPEFSLWAWSAMLYSAGMGAGILLRAVQEPVYMWQYPPFESSVEPRVLALEYTFYQWGFTAWAFYGLFAMVIGYSLFVKQRPVTVSEALSSSVNGKWARHSIDILTIITTVFGLIAAIGLGTSQIEGGINHLFPGSRGLWLALVLAALISVIAFISAWKGVDKGIKILSKYNIVLTLLLLGYILVMGNIGEVFRNLGRALYRYILDFIPLSLALPPLDPDIAFLTDWTFYYWAFWLAWAPFTGIFIARISKGRSLRQLLLGVIFIPSLGTFFWFSVFGTSAFELLEGMEAYKGEFDNVFNSLFVFLSHYPLSGLWNIISLVLLVGFLVTSVDSAVFVLSMYTDHGKKNPGKRHRLIWSVFILMATLALIVLAHVKPGVDVLVAAQKLLIITSLPFSIIMLWMAVVFLRESWVGLKRNRGQD